MELSCFLLSFLCGLNTSIAQLLAGLLMKKLSEKLRGCLNEMGSATGARGADNCTNLLGDDLAEM